MKQNRKAEVAHAESAQQAQETNFDRYLAELLEDPEFRAGFEEAQQEFDVAMQLADLRHRRGLTQQQVADRLHTKQANIARLENPSYSGHSLNMLRRYVQALGARLDISIVIPDEPEASSARA